MINRKLIALLLLSFLVFLYGCPPNSQPTPETEASIPKVEFSLSRESIEISSGLPSGIITITIVQKDANITPTTYDIRLISPREESIYFLDDKENEKITQITTKEFTHVDERQLEDFRILGKKIEGLDYDPYTLKIELYHNNQSIAMKKLGVNVR